ncbi:hypothetical protein KAF25_008114 [Fusarium avenaceum]|uniref:Uncharacterized protein n=1 Tax=Fusarium avenaceum TaxID=40199 RepID=A0A9P7KX07_9HYPO|nr:hypothetical protein KAF25_008114 [Fusarium avenaceum]
MISRAARVPRICVACRFGLITQRSAGIGFRLSPVREGLARRFYTSDIGKEGNSKVEPFITERDGPETKTEELVVEETIATTTESKDVTTPTNNPSSTEANLEPSQLSEEPQLDIDSEAQSIQNGGSSHTATSTHTTESPLDKPLDPAQASLDDLLAEASSTPGEPDFGISDLPDLLESSPGQSELDNLLDGLLTGKKAGDSISNLPELEDELQAGENTFTPVPKKQFHDSLLHGEALGVSTLGLPADAIIINNPNNIRPRRKAPTVLEEQEIETKDLDWKALTPTETVEPEVEEIYANIDEHRPDTRILRMADIGKLVQALCGGFTLSQLRDYQRDRQFQHKDPDSVDYAWIQEIAPWTSVNTVQIRGTSKESIAQRIVFENWKVEVQEHVDNLGKAFITMDPDVFPFLTYGPNNIGRLLWELRRDFLVGEEEKLTLSTDKSRINIFARKSTTYGVLAYIDQVVQQMKTRTIDVSQYLPIGGSIPPTPELRELGRLTKTSIKRSKQGKRDKLRVSWIPEPGEVSSETEDLADTVFRLVVGRPLPGSKNTLQCIPLRKEEHVSGQLVQVQRQARTMSWRDKFTKWSRVVAPVDKTGDDTRPLKLAGSVSLQQTRVYQGPSKSATTATFGHILHSKAETSVKSLSRSRRILSPFTPHPASFSALKPDNDKPLKESTTIVMHLVPRVDRKSDIVKSPEDPAVRIKIPVNVDADLNNFTIPSDMVAECFVPWQIHDVLLPSYDVDIRFQQERFCPLKIDQPGLQKFLETSQFNLLKGRLRTPSQATLTVPGSWTNGPRSGNASTESEDVLYDFRGTEIHQTVEMPWRGHTLRYSSIEAGQHGGQRQEVTLQTGNEDTVDIGSHSERTETFLQLVDEIATGKCFSWTEGYKDIKSRQLEDYSYNLPEEELTEDIIVENDKFDSRGRLNFNIYEEKADQPSKPETFDHIDEMLEDEEPPKTKVGDTQQLLDLLDMYATPRVVSDEGNNNNNNNKVHGVATADKKHSQPRKFTHEGNNKFGSNAAATGNNSRPKRFTDRDNNKVYGTAAADKKHSRPRKFNDEGTNKVDSTAIADKKHPQLEKHTSDEPATITSRIQEESRTNVLNEFFSDFPTKVESSKSQPPTPEPNTIFSTVETPAKPDKTPSKPNKMPAKSNKTPSKTTKQSRKLTLRDLESPAAAKSNEDAFVAQFAARATGESKARDPNAVVGFFDTLPEEKKKKKGPHKKVSQRGKGGYQKHKASKSK